MTDHYYVPRTQKGVFGNALGWVVAIILVVALIAGVTMLVKTLTAGPSGQAGAYRQQQSATNRVFAQQTFEQESADFDGYLAKIATYKGALTDTQQTELRGLRQVCITAAQNYNADARKYLLRNFKSADLPATLDAGAC